MVKVYLFSDKYGKVQTLLCVWLFAQIAFTPFAMGQDVEQLLKKNKFKIGGGVNASQSIYMQDGGTNRRDPYNYFLSGRMLVSYGSLSVPLSFSYSNQRLTYGQPFNIVGISPRYKWITAHMGYRSMNFSPYTLNTHSFLGGGVEIEPVKGWKTSGMYGRMLKAVEPVANGSNRASYERFGAGFKTEFRGKKGSVGISMFTAKDNLASINSPSDNLSLTPQQNLVLGLSLMKRINHWTLSFEGARSALTRDLRSEISSEKPEWYDKIYFIPKRTSTGYYNAYRGQGSYQYKSINVGGTFEHIDPEYRTLGAYFFNNDLQSISGQLGFSLWQNKISFSSSVGRQRNNLDKTKISTMSRWVSAFQLGFVPNTKWNFNLSYSNFQSFTNVRLPSTPTNTILMRPTDTLNFVMVSQSMQGSATFIAKSTENLTSSIMLSASTQKAAQITKQDNNFSPSFYNGYLSYNHGLPKRKFQASIGVNGNISGEQEQQTLFFGPNGSLSKALLEDKWRTSMNVSWNAVWLAEVRTSSVYNVSWTNTYTIAKKHALNCSLNYLHMEKPSAGTGNAYVRPINELNIQMGYGYTF